MGALDHHVGTRRYRVGGEISRRILTKGQMGAVGLIHDEPLPPAVQNAGDGRRVAGRAEVRWVGQHHPRDVRMFFQGVLHLGRRHPAVKAQGTVRLRADEPAGDAPQGQGRKN